MSADRSEFAFELGQTAHVECCGPERPRGILIAYHGYAERPPALLARLEGAGLCENWIVAAPWGLHQFYNRQGEVVASWMTSLHRDEQVAVLCEHARRLASALRERHGDLPLELFGFSQGGANAYRVGMLAGIGARRIHVLAGDLPPECRDALKGRAGAPPVVQLWGSEDERVPLAVLERDAALLAGAGLPLHRFVVPGGHELLPPLLAELRRLLGAGL